MRLIDADELMEAINTWPKFGVDERDRIVPWREGYVPYIHLRDVAIAITGMPTIEPERKTGEWIGTEYDGYADGNSVYYEWKCSKCGCIVEEEGRPTYNYCPNCGARMEV